MGNYPNPSCFILFVENLIQKITYGKVGLITLESSVNSVNLKSLLEQAITDASKLTNDQKKKIEGATIQVYYAGLNNNWHDENALNSKIEKIKYFSDAAKNIELMKSTFYSIPTFFEMYNLKDNTKLKSVNIMEKLEFKLSY